MNVVADRLPVEPTAPGLQQLELAWRENEALGASLRSGDGTNLGAIRALELYLVRRRVLYVHMQAHRERRATQSATSQAVGF